MRIAAGFTFSALPFLLHGQGAWTFAGDTTVTWEQAIAQYEELDRRHAGAKLHTIGTDDDGSPIHLFVISDGGGFSPDSIRASGRNILWITNGIHPGEPDGIDASLLLARALLESDQFMGLTAHTAVCIVPVYNVWGAKQRHRPSRPDQNGPAIHGIRANARNLDLNRDFIKMDAMNTRAMVATLERWDPDIYFETHVSDGADHRYVMELLTTQNDKLDPGCAQFLNATIVPGLYDWMDRKGLLMCPYFETINEVPDHGLIEFNDTPRYSTGFNAMHDRIGILAESHMLKPYAERVNATLQLMLATLAVLDQHPDALRTIRQQARARTAAATSFDLNWQLDTAHVEQLLFKGYAFEHLPSPVSGRPRLKYDRSRPTDLMVPWYATYTPSLAVIKPAGYLVPRAWKEVIDRLRTNGIHGVVLETDTMLDAEVLHIMDLKTGPIAYEGHHLHHDISCSTSRERITAEAGDLFVPMGNPTDRFVMSVLEPECSDSYFAWGFFDEILQQKEWFNAYAFEEVAADLLEKDEVLRNALHEERVRDPIFAEDHWAQLYFIFERSPWAEAAYRRYPVVRVVE
jgi:hypothetical protein